MFEKLPFKRLIDLFSPEKTTMSTLVIFYNISRYEKYMAQVKEFREFVLGGVLSPLPADVPDN